MVLKTTHRVITIAALALGLAPLSPAAAGAQEPAPEERGGGCIEALRKAVAQQREARYADRPRPLYDESPKLGQCAAGAGSAETSSFFDGLSTRLAPKDGELWAGDFETGSFSQWTEVEEATDDRVQLVESPARQGRWAGRFEVRPGDEVSGGNRAEVRTSGDVRFVEGDEYWFGWSTGFSEDFPNEDLWGIFMQLKNDGTGSPPVEMSIQDDEIELKQSTPREGGYKFVESESVDIARGTWHDFVLHVKFSSDPEVGFLELWHNGKLLQPKMSGQTLRPGLFSYVKQGYYRSGDHTQPGVIFQDAMRLGRSYEEVDPARVR